MSPDLISTVTDAVLDEVVTWQQRPLDPVYPLVFFDALRAEQPKVPAMRSIVGMAAQGKIRDEGMVRNEAITAVFPNTVVQTPAFAGAGHASSICCATR